MGPEISTRGLLDALAEGEHGHAFTFGALLDHFRARAYGVFLLVSVLPAFVPLPIGAGAISGPLVMLFGLQLMVQMAHPWIPGFVARRSLSREGVVGHIRLQTAALAAAAQGAVELHLGMPKLHPKALGAAIDAVVDDISHADAVFDGDNGEIGQPPPRPEPQFRQRHEVRVIVDGDRQAQPRPGRRRQCHRPIRQDRGPQHHPLGAVQQPRQLPAQQIGLRGAARCHRLPRRFTQRRDPVQLRRDHRLQRRAEIVIERQEPDP